MNVWTWGECRVDGNELMHYGISGQKHGLRRYQNEDGTLTEEGKARYEKKKDYSSKDGGFIRNMAKSSWYARRSAANAIAKNGKAASDGFKKDAEAYRNQAKKLEKSDPVAARKAEKNANRLEKMGKAVAERSKAQSKANADRKLYEDHTSTKKLVAQDLLLSKHGAQNYRAARARGAGRLRSLLETGAGMDILGTALAAHGNKKKYGKRIVLFAFGDNEYTANALDD